ncbi:hypothetical protein KQX54_014982 [Cotesia glomerata]|uniref:Uncharacterized protein n=1 Tax=Cotesia glomerata TaxID=32391 RepID=A0AAV7IS97_COTGL|nr:hypothetical protein KQX54_014982 [Cotesia glomerata]
MKPSPIQSSKEVYSFMGSLQQPSVLKGKKVITENDAIVPKIFQNIQAQFSKQIAIIYEDENEDFKITYGELERLTNKLARTLKRLCTVNNNRDAIIAVSMKPTYNLPIVLLAILKSGMAYLPLDGAFPQARVTHIIDESQPLMVFVDEDNTLSYGETPVITYNELFEESKAESELPPEYNEDSEELAIVLYTSGSTGVPKGVKLPHATLINRLEWQWRELPFSDKEQKTIFKTALTFVDSAPEIWGSLLQGRTIVVVPKYVTKDPEKFINVLEKHKIQRLVLVPSLLQSMLMYLSLKDNHRSLKSLRLWICSGEILPQTLAKEFFSRFADFGHTLANFYGSTEVMGDVTYYLLNDINQLEDMDKVPIGRPLDNCIIYIVDKNLNLVQQGEIGELVVAGRNLAAGYIRGRDSHRFVTNPHAIDPEYSTIYRTGDFAKIVKGIVIYEGRTDSQIKVRGHRVDLSEVERSVESLPSVDKAVVLCYKPGDLAQALIAFITLKKGTKTTGLQLENYLQNQLPSYMIPHVIIIDSIPLLINGKTDRQTLLKLYETSNLSSNGRDTIDCDYSEVPDEQLAKARILFPTVASVIGRSGRYTVNINANFYDLGGNSLNSIFTVTQLKKQGYHIAISDFLTAKSMREILDKMVLDSNHQEKEDFASPKFIAEPIKDSHRSAVTR